ncbi:unnamed protein product [Protopolystoma xenopodis]|uniref:Uncharacterized protein n=1 Tax=Protopolystoma xenopodis TaxID=117903 RepID=A0A3S5ADK0_9PLAT|nr:unnamed protein product [Protopolystoma xenopodis]
MQSIPPAAQASQLQQRLTRTIDTAQVAHTKHVKPSHLAACSSVACLGASSEPPPLPQPKQPLSRALNLAQLGSGLGECTSSSSNSSSTGGDCVNSA